MTQNKKKLVAVTAPCFPLKGQFFTLFDSLFFNMNQPPEPGNNNTRQSKYTFMIPSIIMDSGGKYPPFFDVRVLTRTSKSKTNTQH